LRQNDLVLSRQPSKFRNICQKIPRNWDFLRFLGVSG